MSDEYENIKSGIETTVVIKHARGVQYEVGEVIECQKPRGLCFWRSPESVEAEVTENLNTGVALGERMTSVLRVKRV